MCGDSEICRIGLVLLDQVWQIFLSLDLQFIDQVWIIMVQCELDLFDLVFDLDKLLCEWVIVGIVIVGVVKDDEVFLVFYILWFQCGWLDSGEWDCYCEKCWMLFGLQ